jgi:hypothetical protein
VKRFRAIDRPTILNLRMGKSLFDAAPIDNDLVSHQGDGGGCLLQWHDSQTIREESSGRRHTTVSSDRVSDIGRSWGKS